MMRLKAVACGLDAKTPFLIMRVMLVRDRIATIRFLRPIAITSLLLAATSKFTCMERANADQIESLRERIASTHDGYASEIVSCKLAFQLFRGGTNSVRRWSRDGVRGVLDDASIESSGAAGLKAFAEACIGRRMSDEEADQMLGTFEMKGQMTREDYSGFTQTFDGADVISTDRSHNQVSLGPRSVVGHRRLRLFDFRTELKPELVRESTVTQENDTLLKLETKDGLGQVLVDGDTSLVRLIQLRDSNNRIRSEIIQMGSLANPSRIPFPKVSVHLRYSPDGVMQHVRVALIEKAEFNCAIPDSEFRQSAARGQTVVDFRKNTSEPSVVVAAEDSPDVLRHYVAGGTEEKRVASNTSRRFGVVSFVALNAVVLGFAAWVIWRRR